MRWWGCEGWGWPARSSRERRDLREGSRSMKEVRTWVPFSMNVRKEKSNKDKKIKVKRLDEKIEAVCLISCEAVRRLVMLRRDD